MLSSVSSLPSPKPFEQKEVSMNQISDIWELMKAIFCVDIEHVVYKYKQYFWINKKKIITKKICTLAYCIFSNCRKVITCPKVF